MLTDTACKNAHKSDKAKLGKAFKLADEKGLFLLVKPNLKGCAKWWRFKCQFGANIFSWLGNKPITDILPCLRRVEDRGTIEPPVVLCKCGQVFRYAAATGRADDVTGA
jgi:hypothetical protein